MNTLTEDPLIPLLKTQFASHDTSNFSVLDFVGAFGSPVEALAYSRLFWPDFVEYQGMTFRKDALEDESDRQRVLEALVQYDQDRTRTEQSFNLTEVPSTLFTRRASESTDDIDLLLANQLAEMWRARLHLLFPHLRFVVEVLSPKESGGEIALWFYRIR